MKLFSFSSAMYPVQILGQEMCVCVCVCVCVYFQYFLFLLLCTQLESREKRSAFFSQCFKCLEKNPNSPSFNHKVIVMTSPLPQPVSCCSQGHLATHHQSKCHQHHGASLTPIFEFCFGMVPKLLLAFLFPSFWLFLF